MGVKPGMICVAIYDLVNRMEISFWLHKKLSS